MYLTPRQLSSQKSNKFGGSTKGQFDFLADQPRASLLTYKFHSSIKQYPLSAVINPFSAVEP